ncbi:type II secretory pathway protein [Edwardsiella ictaluri]|nr:type II secretory pathway protein [Edwardsiella ictaluri]KMQ78980.1 type II secretory pathway protein [Edwardsiella ictaluri]KOO55452.1 type II secretory pathway protein [Edwardsiella ictaluri]
MRCLPAYVAALTVLLVMSPTGQAMPLTLWFDRAPLSSVLQAVAEFAGLNLILSEEVRGEATVHIAHTPWPRVLDALAEIHDLSVVRRDGILLIQSRARAARQIRPAAAPVPLKQPQMRSQRVVLHYADAATVEKSLRQRRDLLGETGSAVADSRTNALLLRAEVARLAPLRDWIAQLDVPLPQVQLAAHIVSISQEGLRELGIRWSSGDQRSRGQDTLRGAADAYFSAGFQVARIGGQTLAVALAALERQDKVAIIASPHLMAAHGQTASIKQGSELPYAVSGGERGVSTMEFKEAVLGMSVTPRILADARIELALQISQNMPGRVVRQGDSEALAIDKQEITTQVTLADGDTAMLGGIFQYQRQVDSIGFPWLADVPLLGHLLRSDSQRSGRRELVIFITPTLLSASSLLPRTLRPPARG